MHLDWSLPNIGAQYFTGNFVYGQVDLWNSGFEAEISACIFNISGDTGNNYEG